MFRRPISMFCRLLALLGILLVGIAIGVNFKHELNKVPFLHLIFEYGSLTQVDFDPQFWADVQRTKVNRERENELAECPPSRIGSAVLALRWGSPILRTTMETALESLNLANFPELGDALDRQRSAQKTAPDIATLALSLSRKLVLTHYDKLQRMLNNSTEMKGGHKAGSVNQMFFEYQTTENRWENEFAETPEIRAVVAAANAAVDLYLERIGQGGERNRVPSTIWATAHEHGAFHLPHSHAESRNSVSCVVYIHVPLRAFGGELLLDDPRGSPHPPFDDRLIISPVTGDIVVFPSWLVHSVNPTLNTEETADEVRLSIAMNFEGDWRTTARVNHIQEINLPQDASHKRSRPKGWRR